MKTHCQTTREARVEDDLITIKEAARRLQIHPNTAYRLIRAGEFPVPTIQVGKRRKVSSQVLNELLGNGHDLDTTSRIIISR